MGRRGRALPPPYLGCVKVLASWAPPIKTVDLVLAAALCGTGRASIVAAPRLGRACGGYLRVPFGVLAEGTDP